MPVSVAALLDACARDRADKRVLLTAGGEAMSWRACAAMAGGLAARLSDGGIGNGSRVALDFDDPLLLTVAVFGVLKTGACATPLNPRLTAAERGKILEDLAPERVVRSLPDEDADFPATPVGAEDNAFVLYTSGSTGTPKGARLSQRATAFALESWRHPVMMLSETDVSLAALPLAHSLGIFGAVLGPLLSGGSVVFLDRFSAEDALAAIARHRVTVFPGVATMFRRILESPALAGADLVSLRYALSGAAPCPWELVEAWRRATGLRILRGYGMTELFRPISYRASDGEDRPEAIGRAVPGVSLRVVGEDEAPLAAGETGELWIDSPARMSAYHGRPEETTDVLSGRWFKTGDLATVSEDGFVRIVGRKKDMIMRGGFTVAAGEVEAVLQTHPAIVEAAVVGVGDADLGEEIAAFVVFRPGGSATSDELEAYCRERMAGYKCPRHFRIVEHLPKGPAGKVVKAGLRLAPRADGQPETQSNTVSS